MKELERAIERLGGTVYAEGGAGIKKGRAVIFPARLRHRQWEEVTHLPQGRSEAKRYIMFCGTELLESSDYGSRIYSGSDRFVLIWKDEVVYRTGAYYRACLRKITEEEDGEN